MRQVCEEVLRAGEVKRVNDIKEENEEDEWMTVMRIDDYRRVR